MVARRIPSLNWLRVFEAAARLESFARAAEMLHMSAAGVSQQVQALESHLGQELFIRSARKVVLSDAGRAFLPVVQQSLASVETAAAALFGAVGQQTVTLQVVTVLALGWIGPRIAAFEAAHPGIRVNITTGNMLSDFRSVVPGREADLQIAFGSVTDFGENAMPLLQEELSIVATPQICRRIAGPADLRGYRLIEVATHRAGWHQVLAALPEIDMRDMEISFVDNTPAALVLAHQGLGLALERAPATDMLVAALDLSVLPFPAPMRGLQQYYLLRSETQPLSPAVARLADWLLETARTQPRKGRRHHAP